uniref:PSI domain-containing protein n=1 Tax=Arion vulgaris TaxID=1028688 RepID=A0A0B7APQ8_9EUPU
MDTIVFISILGMLIIPVLPSTTETTSNTQTTVTPSNKNSSEGTTSPSIPSTTSELTKATTTLTPEQECATLSASCDTCLKNDKCLYCNTNNTCMLYPHGKILPSSSDCALDEARWLVCWLNFEAMIISVGVIGGVIILTITFCCIYCCCCRNGGRKQQEREDRKLDTQKMERRTKQDERRTERKGRMDDIRKKYGLMKDDAPYQQFDS